MKTQIIIHDSFTFNLECLRCYLEKNNFNQNYEIIGTTSFEQISKLMSENASALVINILGININDAYKMVEKTLGMFKKLKIMILSPSAEPKVIKKFFDKGIKAFLTKETDRAELLKAMNSIQQDIVYVSEEAKKSLFDFICHIEHQKKHQCTLADEITTREKEVLKLICEGLKGREIADQLFISTHTVDSHRRNIMMKLNVNSSSMLVKLAMENKLVS